MSLVDAFENTVLDALLGDLAVLLGDPVAIGLSTTTPTDVGGNFTEPGGYGYARVSIVNDSVEWPNAALGIKKNANTISFPQASGGSWSTLTHWGLFDGGVLTIWGILDDGAGNATPRTVLDTDTFKILADGLRITLD